MLEIEHVRENVAQLNENEAKNLLMIIYANLDVTLNGNNKDEIKKTLINYLIFTKIFLINKNTLEVNLYEYKKSYFDRCRRNCKSSY